MSAIAIVLLRGRESWDVARSIRAFAFGPFALAVGIQSGNLFLDAWMWKPILERAGVPISLWSLVRLSGQVLFANQILPVGGVSGTLTLVRGLETRGARRAVSLAAAFITATSFYAAWAFALAAACALSPIGRRSIPLAVVAPLVALALALVAARSPRIRTFVASRPLAIRLVTLFSEVDRPLATSSALLLRALALQLLCFALDSASLWALVKACGGRLSPTDAFTTWMLGTIAQAAFPIMNGLGAVEAALVLRLLSLDVDAPSAIATATLFRLIRFWLPLVPGLAGLPKRPPRPPSV